MVTCLAWCNRECKRRSRKLKTNWTGHLKDLHPRYVDVKCTTCLEAEIIKKSNSLAQPQLDHAYITRRRTWKLIVCIETTENRSSANSSTLYMLCNSRRVGESAAPSFRATCPTKNHIRQEECIFLLRIKYHHQHLRQKG